MQGPLSDSAASVVSLPPAKWWHLKVSHFGHFSIFFHEFWSFFKIIGGGKAANKSAASAASPDYVKFQAVIKSAASAASQIQGTQTTWAVGRRGRPDDGSVRTTERGAPLELPSLDFAFGEAALAADLITA